MDLNVNLEAELDIEQLQQAALLSPEAELEFTEDRHRKALDACLRRRTVAKREGDAAIQEWTDERRRIEMKYQQDMERIDNEIVTIRQTMQRQIATADKLAASERAALEALQK